MNGDNLQWEQVIKQDSLGGSGMFTEEMRQSVLQAVDTRRKNPMQLFTKSFAVTVVSITLGILIMYWPLGNLLTNDREQFGSDIVENVIHNEAPINFRPLDAKVIGNGGTIYDNDPNILPGLGNKVNPLRDVDNRMIEEISISDIDLIDQKQVDGYGSILRYTLLNNSETKYNTDEKLDYIGVIVDGYTEAGTLHHFGFGHLFDDAQVGVTRIFGNEDVLKLWLVCGVDGSTCTYYLKRQADGLASYLMFNARMFENDLDGDGIEEAIAVTHKQNQIYIFKENGEQLLWASVRETLGVSEAATISYNDVTGLFSMSSEGQSEPVSTYRYASGEDKMVKVDTEE